MAGVEKVSEREIIDAAGALLIEEKGELRRVSARQVQKRTGGSNKRVNEIVAVWKEQKAESALDPFPEEGPEPAVPEPISRVLDEITAKLQHLGLSVAHLIDDAVRTERQRCDRDVALEQERAKTAIDRIEKDLHAARVESNEYSEDLDRAETVLANERTARADLTDALEKLRVKLADAERSEERATAEAAKQTEFRQITDQSHAQIEAQLAANSDTHIKELEAFQADYRAIQDWSREKAAKLSDANATIRELRNQIEAADAKLG